MALGSTPPPRWHKKQAKTWRQAIQLWDTLGVELLDHMIVLFLIF